MRKRGLNRRANLIACAIAAVVVIGGWGVTLMRRIGTVEPNIKIERVGGESIAARAKEMEIREITAIMGGEVATTSSRLRSACSMALVAGLVSIDDRPANTTTLLQKIVDKALLPPGMARTAKHQLETRFDILSVRSQMSPLKIEVVSIAKEQRFGPGLVVRLAAELFEGEGAQLWVYRTLDQTVLPPPFAAEQELMRLGWRQEPLVAARNKPR